MPEILLEELTKALFDQGLIVQAGWVAFQLMAIPPDAPDIQISEMRKAYFSGAQHLFASMITMFEEDREPTEKDLDRLMSLQNELQAWVEEMKKLGQIKTEKTNGH